MADSMASSDPDAENKADLTTPAGASAAIFGCAGLSVSDEERAFFAEAQPWGFILFARNIETPDQTRGLVDALRRRSDGARRC